MLLSVHDMESGHTDYLLKLELYCFFSLALIDVDKGGNLGLNLKINELAPAN